MASPSTVFQILEETARKHGAKQALQQPYTVAGKRSYHRWTWAEFREASAEIGAGLYALGIRKGDIVALNSETRAEFYLADLGIMAIGAVAAALYPSYPPADLIRTIANCDARVLFVENAATFKALRDAPVEHFILLTGEAEDALSLDQLRERGRQALADPACWPTISGAVEPADPAILYLTSGATGEPKMVLVTHRALLANLETGPEVLPLTPDDITVAFLPSAHIAQRVVAELLPIYFGAQVAFTDSLMKLPQEIRHVRPTLFLAPPRMWERVYSTICTEVRKKPAAMRKIFYGAVGLGTTVARLRREGKPVPPHLALPLRLADRLVFRKIRARFGGRLRIAASGAAPLGADLADFYAAIGMPLIEGYGLTEAGVAAFNPLSAAKPGSIGRALPGVQIRVADDGELLIRSPSLFIGYYKDAEATRDVLRDGWLHTGDVGYRDEDGYYYITGRIKELIVSSNGKKIFPARVENLFKFEPLISQMLLVGDRLPFLTALFTINQEVASHLTTPVATEIQKIVNRVNKQLAPFEQVRKFRILPRDFTIESGELTATMKVRRQQVIKNFQSEIEALYEGREG